VVLGERMPLDRSAYAWLDEQEKGDRKNARVVDRVVVALPSELSREQNIELLHSFGERMTEGDGPALAAAGFATVMSGLMNITTNLGTQITIGASGAFAVLVLFYLQNPAVLQ
jgi:hypothetical protein